MTAYYNEFDKNAAAWLRELISDGLIAPGDVDERSIIDVDYRDLDGYTQHHFFAGIGGWSYALRIAGWPDDARVWTASLPCQPFSTAGKGLGKADERHLLPHFLELVAKCKPGTIFGEQVERAIGHGWLDDLQATMEAENYAVGHVVLGAHSIGAPHIRQRLYWVADRNFEGLQGRERTECTDKFPVRPDGMVNRLANPQSERIGRTCRQGDGSQGADALGMGYKNGEFIKSITGSPIVRLGTPDSPGLRQRIEATETARHRGSIESTGRSNISWIYCKDGKHRPIEPGILPLANGIPKGMVYSSDPNATQEARAMRLKGYGNAIVPQVAAEFIRAFMALHAC